MIGCPVRLRSDLDGACGYAAAMDQDSTLLDTADTEAHDDELVDELLIEEISIDGMCGVY